jgi:hypothetical protein
MDRGAVYRAPSQAGPGNDINVGSSGSQKAPTWSPASLVANPGKREPSRFATIHSYATAQAVARARWRRCFAHYISISLQVVLREPALGGFLCVP